MIDKKFGMFQSDPDETPVMPSACPVSDIAKSFDPFSAEYLRNPYLFFDKARNREPVFYSPELNYWVVLKYEHVTACLLYTSPSPRDRTRSRMPSSA